MLPMTHHKTRSQSNPFKPGLRFTIEDALFQVAISELKTREAINLVISLAANESLTEENSRDLGAIAGRAGYRKADNPYDHKSQRKLFASFERGLKVGRGSSMGEKKLRNKPKQKKPTNTKVASKTAQSARRKRLH